MIKWPLTKQVNNSAGNTWFIAHLSDPGAIGVTHNRIGGHFSVAKSTRVKVTEIGDPKSSLGHCWWLPTYCGLLTHNLYKSLMGLKVSAETKLRLCLVEQLLKDTVCVECAFPGFPLLKTKNLQILQWELCIKILYTNIYFTELFNNPWRNGSK